MPTPPPIKSAFIAGLGGQIAFETYAFVVSPLLFGVTLQPTNLVVALAGIWFGLDLPHWLGFALHFALGALVFPALVLAAHLVTRANLLVCGAAVGLGLWFVAQGVLAQAAGRAFMMGFGPYTQSSLVAHVGMTTLMAIAMLGLQARPRPVALEPAA